MPEGPATTAGELPIAADPAIVELLAAEASRDADRARLFMGLIESIHEAGFRGTTVADIVRRAKTSRRTFYRYFPDREACFIALAQELNTVVAAEVNATWDPTLPWEGQVDRTVDQYLAIVAIDPALTVSLTREIPGLGEAGMQHQREDLDLFADVLLKLVEASREHDSTLSPMSKTAAVILAGGLREVVVYAIEHDIALEEVGPTARSMIKALLRPA
jgi:AcrR family transcriptional regulator